MTSVSVFNSSRGQVLAAAVGLADRWWLRLRGLLGRPPLARGEGLLLRPCRAVHMWGVHYPIDVAFLNREGTVIARYPGLGPGERTPWHPGASQALELPAGVLESTGTLEGDTLICAEIAPA